MTTPRDDIAGLIETFNAQYEEQGWPPLREAATQLGALSARVKELDLRYLGAVAARRILRDHAEKTEARALRAEQERDEAYERAAKVAESNDRRLEWVNDGDVYKSPTRRMQNIIAAEIRRLASGPEKEKK